ncbi:hypothetical protein ACFSQ7_12210 [Paenibacillus rhizoplanae]
MGMGKRLSALILTVLFLGGCSEGGPGMNYAERQAAAAGLDSGLADSSNRLGVKLFGQLWKQGGREPDDIPVQCRCRSGPGL